MLRRSLACRAGISFIKFWSLTLPLYHPQMAMATAHTFEIVEGESGGRLFAVSITQDKVSHTERERVVWGFSDWIQNLLVFRI